MSKGKPISPYAKCDVCFKSNSEVKNKLTRDPHRGGGFICPGCKEVRKYRRDTHRSIHATGRRI